jgi:hypothetical protein
MKKVKKLEEVIFWNVSLDREIWDEGRDTLADIIEDWDTLRPDQFAEKNALRRNLDTILSMLDDRESKIIKMRYGIDWPRYTLEQVWEEFDVTRERVRQIEQKVIQKLKDHEWLLRILWIEDDIAKIEEMEKMWKRKKWKRVKKLEEDEDDIDYSYQEYLSEFDDDDDI